MFDFRQDIRRALSLCQIVACLGLLSEFAIVLRHVQEEQGIESGAEK